MPPPAMLFARPAGQFAENVRKFSAEPDGRRRGGRAEDGGDAVFRQFGETEMWEALWIADYIVFRDIKEYHMLKPFYFVMNAVTIVAVIFWMFKKMNGFAMLMIMILTNLDCIRIIKGYLMELRFLNVVVLLFCLFMHVLPMFVIKDKREIL